MPVVVGVDASTLAPLVIHHAAEHAKTRKTDLHVVHVFHPPILPYMGAPIDMSAIEKSQRQAVWQSISPTLDSLEVDVERVDLEGYPPDTLVDYAKNVKASLLVVGSRGRGEFASLILGSTSHRAIHLASCDVLVVKGE